MFRPQAGSQRPLVTFGVRFGVRFSASLGAVLGIVVIGCTPVAPPVEAPMAEAPPARPMSASASATAAKEPALQAVDPPEAPLRLGGLWRGVYVCAQGSTELQLEIDDTAPSFPAAVFEFTHPPTGVHGAFEMRGTFDPRTRRLRLHAGKWLDRPPGYVPVDIEANLGANGASLTGHIVGPGCTIVALQRP